MNVLLRATRRVGPAVATLTLGVLLAACGSESTGGLSLGNQQQPANATTGQGTATGGGTTSGGTTTGGDTSTSGGGSSTGGTTSAPADSEDTKAPDVPKGDGQVCAIALEYQTKMSELLEGAQAGDQKVIAEEVKVLNEAFDKMSGAVPGELKGDLETLRQAINKGLSGAQGEFMKVMTSPEVQAASERLGAFFDKTCPDQS